MHFSALNENRLYLKVADQILDLVKKENLKPGDRLPSERVLSTSFSISRPTVREAMVALELAGMIEIRTASGIYLTKTALESTTLKLDRGPGPFEILEARMFFEKEVCAMAAERITDEQLEELSALLTAMIEENEGQTPAEKADEQFHCAIAVAAGNSAVLKTVEWLWRLRNESELVNRFHRYIRMDGIRPIIDDHQRILDALKARDPEAARAAMQQHLKRVIDGLL